MTKITVEFEWDGDDLGPFWFNEDNLKACLFSKTCTRPDLLGVKLLQRDGDIAITQVMDTVEAGASVVGLKIDTL